VGTIFVLFSALLQLAGVSQKGAYGLVCCPDFCGCCQGTPPDHLAVVTSRLMFVVSGLYICTCYKLLCLRVYHPINLNLRAERDPPIWDIDRSWHILNSWETLKIK